MGSLIQFQDLNLYPELSPTATTSPTVSAAVAVAAPRIPKIEPKLEPLDIELYFSNPNHGFGFSSQTETSIPDPNLNSNTGNGSILQSQDNSSDETNVFSEFYRISEMFSSAFAKHLQRYGDVEVMNPNSGAIVPVPDENQLNAIAVSTRRRYQKRSSELVRVTGLGIEDQRYFRDLVRKTRMLYDSLRVLAVAEDEKTRGLEQERRSRARGDLKAAAVMKQRGLWLNRVKRVVGSLPGVHIGDLFFFRMELCVVGLHGQAQAGIDYLSGSQSANGEPIATSIIVSGGYEDDEDAGDVIIYTGHGGQDKHNRQCEHQKLEGGNLAMERSMYYGIEVRVIRGFKYEGSASGKVYVYDGLYKIIDSWFDVGKSGFGVYKFKLIRIENQPELGSSVLKFAASLRSKPLVVRPMGYISFDMSRKKENLPIFLFNDIDNDYDPIYFEYLVSTKFPAFAYHYGGSQTGCDCVAGCFSGCLCAMKNGGEFAYDQNGILMRGKPLIFECGPHCRCPPSCRNRVSQKGVKSRFEVFRSKETGWGVRSLDLMQAGSFICEYSGVALTREQAQIFTMNGDSLVYPNRFAEKWVEWGDLSQIFSDYVRPSYPSVPPLDFAIDVSTMRNVACYISHSPSPNVLVQLVLYDHNNISFPRLMLFAMENIPPLRELSLDYGVADEWSGKLIRN